MSRHYHLIGIGGIGMSGIAKLFLERGCRVSGSDLKESTILNELREKGAEIFLQHHPQNIKGSPFIVYSSAIKEDNPEIQEAKRRRLPILQRAEALAELMQDKKVITVSGSHGKTTTASLVSYLLWEAGLFPTIAVGGILKNIDTNAYFGRGNFFVAEADESDGSFLCYHPKYSIITNVDREHLDYYKEFGQELAAFRKFLNQTQEDGCAFCCADDRQIKKMLKDYRHRHILFGLSSEADIYPKNIRMQGLISEFDCFYKHKFIGRFSLVLGGAHNISNALSVIAVGLELGIALEVIQKTLAQYKGTKRRLEVKFDKKGILIIDDYAHHPTEIKATLAAARNLKPKRLIAVFQPHRFSRTKILLEDFGRCFTGADRVIVTDIYAASEQPIAGLSGETVLNKIKENFSGAQAEFLPKEKIIPHLLEIMRPKDLVLLLGAGDIVKVGDELVERVKRQG